MNDTTPYDRREDETLADSLADLRPRKAGYYVFTAEDKHAKYNLIPGERYRAYENEQGQTVGRPVLIGEVKSLKEQLRDLLPFVGEVEDCTEADGTVTPNPARGTILALDIANTVFFTALAVLIIILIAVL